MLHGHVRMLPPFPVYGVKLIKHPFNLIINIDKY